MQPCLELCCYTCMSVEEGFLFFHLNVKFHMLYLGMYSPVILPAVPDCTLVNPATRDTKTGDGHDDPDTYRAVSEKVVCCALALDCIISFGGVITVSA